MMFGDASLWDHCVFENFIRLRAQMFYFYKYYGVSALGFDFLFRMFFFSR